MTPAERLEKKVDELREDVRKLLLIEERQKQDWRRMGAIEERLEKVEAKATTTAGKLEKWIDRGIGAWALATLIVAVIKAWPAAANHPVEIPRAIAPAIPTPSTH